jgi:hypothetical protein
MPVGIIYVSVKSADYQITGEYGWTASFPSHKGLEAVFIFVMLVGGYMKKVLEEIRVQALSAIREAAEPLRS